MTPLRSGGEAKENGPPRTIRGFRWKQGPAAILVAARFLAAFSLNLSLPRKLYYRGPCCGEGSGG